MILFLHNPQKYHLIYVICGIWLLHNINKEWLLDRSIKDNPRLSLCQQMIVKSERTMSITMGLENSNVALPLIAEQIEHHSFSLHILLADDAWFTTMAKHLFQKGKHYNPWNILLFLSEK